MKLSLSFVSLLILMSCAFFTNAQISQGGTPRSFDLTKAALFSQKVPVADMISVDVPALRAEDAIVDGYKDRPWRFGENLYVNLNVKTDGVMTLLPNGDKVYRLGIKSPGATSLNLTFDNFQIPAGSELFIYSKDQTQVLGAFTSENNQSDGVFATTLIFTDEIVLEYYEPVSTDFAGVLHLYRVTHGYRGPSDFMKAFGTSGSCQVNVACSTGTGWDDQIKSVCMLVSGGAGFCTGSLVNNTSNDGTPYILTANHCYSTPTSWVFWFNWQSATCANPGSSPSYNSITGATLKARTTTSDFCLVQMNSTPPASYGVYYAGWNRNTAPATSVTCIHHPDGDIKKISLGNAPTAADDVDCGNGPADCWFVQWSGTACTEGGSSGSPLFDQNHLIVGQLYGGTSACGASASYMNDYYGRFSVSWDGDGTNTTRLSNWLDPTSTGVTTQPGYDPNAPTIPLDAQVSAITSPTGSTCGSNSFTPVVTLTNKGVTTLTSATVAYSIDGGAPVTQAWTGSLATNYSATVTFPTVTGSYASHTMKSWSTLPNGGSDGNTINDTTTTTFTLSNGTFTVPFAELFNGAAFPPSCWASYIGTNGLGTASNWVASSTTYEGAGAAYVEYENVTGGSAEDWLVTPLITLQNGSNLSFYQRQSYSTSYGSSYSVRVSTTSQTSQTSFTTVSTWAESTFSTSYTKKTIDLSAYNGQSVYIAFVMTNDDGDDWYIDSVRVYGTCTAPVAAFSASSTTPCANTTVTMTDATTNSPTSWTWTVTPPTYSYVGGTSASSQNPQIQFSAAGTYTIQLTATNGCGSDAENKVGYITVTAPPAQPSAISGNANPCSGATGVTYSVTNVGGVTYNWSLPAGWTQTGGGTTNSITVTAGSAGGTITVTPSNGCTGTPRTLTVTINTVPAQPSAVTGLAGPCQGSSENYSVTNVSGVTYTWSVPGGWTINSGQNSNSINTTVGASSGTITVTPSNTCGNGTAQTISVVASVLPVQPSAITGDNTPCQSSQSYSVTTVAGITYTWSFPAGWIISAGQGTNTITVTPSATAGTISVVPSNGCGTGTAQTLTATPEALPAQPSAISGAAAPCAGTSQNYSVTNVGGITYTWLFPSGWSIVSGQGSNSVTVTAGSTSGTVTVTPSTACGNGTSQTLTLSPNALPSQPTVSGSSSPCQGATVTYSVPNVSGETYVWSVPADWTISGGQNTSAITVVVGSQSGSVSVTPSNGCGSGSAGFMTVSSSVAPAQPSAIAGLAYPCIGSSQVYSVTNVAGLTYTWTLPGDWTQTSGGTSNSITVSVGTMTGDITVTPSNSCGNGIAQTLTVASVTAPIINLGPDTAICNDQSLTLDAGSSFSSYSWSTGSTASTITVSGATTGVGTFSYSVTAQTSNGCVAGDNIMVEVIDCSGIETEEMPVARIFPNPANDVMNIAFAESLNNIIIRLYDATGRLVFYSEMGASVKESVVSVPVSEFGSGMYSLQIVSDESVQINSVLIY